MNCHFGSACTRRDCKFKHDVLWCYFDKNCNKPGCIDRHPSERRLNISTSSSSAARPYSSTSSSAARPKLSASSSSAARPMFRTTTPSTRTTKTNILAQQRGFSLQQQHQPQWQQQPQQQPRPHRQAQPDRLEKGPCRESDNCTDKNCSYAHSNKWCRLELQCPPNKFCPCRHPDNYKRKCQNGTMCYKKDCQFDHKNDWCPQETECPPMVYCPHRHPKGYKVKCTDGTNCRNIDCKFLHPNNCRFFETNSYCGRQDCQYRHPRDCKNGVACERKDCRYRHMVAFCEQDKACQSFSCNRRHSVSTTTRLCNAECTNVSCKLVHPRQRPFVCPRGIQCSNATCGGLHPPPEVFIQDEQFWREIQERYASSISSSNNKHTGNGKHFVTSGVNFVKTIRKDIATNLSKHQKVMQETKARLNTAQISALNSWDPQEGETLSATAEVQKTAYEELLLQQNAFLKSVKRALDSFLAVSINSNTLTFLLKREKYRLIETRLPALALRLEFEEKLETNQVVVVRGQTGSGKSTQLPQYLAEFALLQQRSIYQDINSSSSPSSSSLSSSVEKDERNVNKSKPNRNRNQLRKVICTQPRKIAATSLAGRVASEFACGEKGKFAEVGNNVGYRVGGDTKSSRFTRLEYVTEELFLSSILNNKLRFDDVFAVVVDEAHERNISTDLVLGVLKKKMKEYPHLKVVVTSATLDPKVFSTYFGRCGVVEIPGRMFPVDIVYDPPTPNTTALDAAVQKALEVHLTTNIADGDILCFLTGQDEIEKAKVAFEAVLSAGTSKHHSQKKAIVLTAYGKQSAEDQKALFDAPPKGARKVIFATDVAETSVTIDGVRFVIDSGLKKDVVYDSKRNMTSLQVMSISQSSATQRKGRAGRTSSGTCIRLYSKQQYDEMPLGVVPEVLRMPLGLTVVNLLALGVDPLTFDWLDPPDTVSVRTAMEDLLYLGAIISAIEQPPPQQLSEGKRYLGLKHTQFLLTELGKFISDSQIEPCWARMIAEGCKLGFGNVAVLLASIASVSDTFFWRVNVADEEKKAKASAAKAALANEYGDLCAMYRLYVRYEELQNPSLDSLGQEVVSSNEHRSNAASPSLLTEENLAELMQSIQINVPVGLRNLDEESEALGHGNFSEDSLSDTESAVSDDTENFSLNDFAGDGDDEQIKFGNREDGESVTYDDDANTVTNDSVDDDDEDDIAEQDVNARFQSKGKATTNMKERKRLAFESANKMLRDNFVSQKAVALIRTNQRQLLKAIRSFPSFWKHCEHQDRKPSDMEIAKLLLHGMFLNVAFQVNSLQYRTVRSKLVAGISSTSILAQYGQLPPVICYQSILRTNSVLLLSPLLCQREWLQEISSEFVTKLKDSDPIDTVSYKTEVLPRTLLRGFSGKGGYKLRNFENVNDCIVEVDYNQGVIVLWVNKSNLEKVKLAVHDRLDALRQEVMEEVEEVQLNSSTRILIGKGGKMITPILGNEFVSVVLRGLQSTATVDKLKMELQKSYGQDLLNFVIMEDQSTRTTKDPVNMEGGEGKEETTTSATSQEHGKFVVHATFAQPPMANKVIEKYNNELFDGCSLNATCGGIVVPTMFKDVNARLKLSYCIGKSIGKASMTFATAEEANTALMKLRSHFFSRNTKIEPCGSLNPQSDEQLYQPEFGQRTNLNKEKPMGGSARKTSPDLPPLISNNRKLWFASLPDSVEKKNYQSSPKDGRAAKNNTTVAKKFTVVIKDLPQDVDENKLRNIVLETNIKALSVLVKREFNSSMFNNISLVEFVADLQSCVPRIDLQPTMLEFHDEKFFMEGFLVTYNDINDTKAALESLGFQREFMLQGVLVRVEPEFMATVSFHRELYKFLQVEIQYLLKNAPATVSIKHRDKLDNKRQPKVVFQLFSTNLEDIERVQKEFTKALSYSVYSHKYCRLLFTMYGRKELAKISDMHAYIYWDNRKKMVLIYGNEEQQNYAMQKLDELATVLSNLVCDQPVLLTNIGIKSFKSQQQQLVTPDIKDFTIVRRTLWLTGTATGVNELQNLLQEKSWVAKRGGAAAANNNNNNDSPECCICMMKSDSEPLLILSCCSSYWDADCLEHMVSVAAKSSVPIGCGMCNTPMALSDLRAACTPDVWARLMERTMIQYLSTTSEYRGCVSPLCPQVLRIPSKPTDVVERESGGYTVYCDLCQKTYCLTCSTRIGKPMEAHIGNSCSELDTLSDDKIMSVAEKHRNTILELFNPACPRCHNLFYDFDGCCAVYCGCGCSFCGLCYADCGSDAHAHVRQCSLNPCKNNYFLSKAQIAIVHAEQNRRKFEHYINNNIPDSEEKLRQLVRKLCEKDLELL